MTIFRTGLTMTALVAMTAQSWAACDTGSAAALKTAAVQQELMVAGLTCGDVDAYNRFVLAYQPQLQHSDAALMTYFRDRDGSEAGYDSYKTKLANLAAGQAGANGARYCAAASRLFAAAAGGQTLENFIGNERLLIAAPEACAVQYDVDMRVAGVPDHALPAAPFGAPEASAPVAAPLPAAAPAKSYSPPPRAADPDRREAYNDLPRPPRYAPRDSDADWGDSYAYGPPQAWQPRPRRWSWYSAYNGD